MSVGESEHGVPMDNLIILLAHVSCLIFSRPTHTHTHTHIHTFSIKNTKMLFFLRQESIREKQMSFC